MFLSSDDAGCKDDETPAAEQEEQLYPSVLENGDRVEIVEDEKSNLFFYLDENNETIASERAIHSESLKPLIPVQKYKFVLKFDHKL